MQHFRFSLSSLLAVVVLTGIICAALASASSFWSRLLSTLTMAILLVSLVGAIYRQGAARAFWIGFAILGWGYWIIGYLPLQNFALNLLERELADHLSSVAPGPFVTLLHATHAIIVLILACAGGMIGSWFYWREHRQADP